MFVASLLNFTLLTPVHLLWINMVTDSLPGLALGMEKAEGDVMQRKPRNSSDGIFSHGAGLDMVWQGIYLAIIELAAFFIGLYLEKGTISGIPNKKLYLIKLMSKMLLLVQATVSTLRLKFLGFPAGIYTKIKIIWLSRRTMKFQRARNLSKVTTK